ncbi:cysteine peptidase family C39 domain-containing protein, partial [Photobacterium carnosum]
MKDPLLQSLAYISRFYGQANSPDALIADLPLTDGLLTPFLLPRAAEKAGLQAKQTQLTFDKLSPLLFPVIAILKGGDACVVLSIDQEKGEAEVVLPQSDGSEQWI